MGSIAATQSQMILLKSQDIAKEIIAKAIDLHCRVLDVADSCDSEFGPGLSASESQFLFESKDLVQEVIERALELNQAEALSKNNTTDESEAVMAIFEAVDPTRGLSAVQSQIFFRAKEMVHDAVSRAIMINTGVNAMNACLNTQSTATTASGFKESDPEVVMARVEDIVDKVIRKAIKMNLESMEAKSLHAQSAKAKYGGKGRMPSIGAVASPPPPPPLKGNLKKGLCNNYHSVLLYLD